MRAMAARAKVAGSSKRLESIYVKHETQSKARRYRLSILDKADLQQLDQLNQLENPLINSSRKALGNVS